jgi:thioredoxin-dependent peroxiredoxin
VSETVKVGDRFPVAELVASDGERIDLEALTGPAIVYFYPANGSEVCTLEAALFNRAVDDFEASGIALVGVSVDDEESHRCFASDEGLRFPLVSDRGGELTDRLGIGKDFGEEYGVLARRTTYLLDRDGVVRQTWTLAPDDVPAHPAEVLEAARALVAS